MAADPPDARLTAGFGLKVLYLNARSIRNKLDDLERLISDLNPDIIAITKTCLTPRTPDSDVAIPGYHIARADRAGTKLGGGVALLWKENLVCHSLQHICDADAEFESIWGKINNGLKTISIGVVYRSPGTSAKSLLHHLRFNLKGRSCLLLGDFNSPGIDWETIVCNQPTDSFESQFLESLLSCGLIQHVTTPTRFFPGQRSNVLDLVITPTPFDIDSLMFHDPIASSDHCSICFR